MKKFGVIIGLLLIGVGLWVWLRPDTTLPDTVAAPPLRLHQGIVIGSIAPANPDIQVFSGIPYASAQRWSPPSAPPQWGAVPRTTQEFGPECMQSDTGLARFYDDILSRSGLNRLEHTRRKLDARNVLPSTRAEDCLFLNVRTGNIGKSTLQPVMVWLHGGGHQFGSGSSALYQSDTLVENGVVLISINYRLGAFGYLAHPALTQERGTSGNYGLLDQVAALKWVRSNAALFGGDPGNVTLFGESSGAQSISELMATPLADGLYHKVILQSGASTFNARHLGVAPLPGGLSAEDAGQQFMAELVEVDAAAEDLRAVSAEAIVTHAETRADLTRHFLPNVDGDILPEMIAKRIRDGDAPRLPMIVGYNADEGSLFYERVLSPTSLHAPIKGSFEAHEAALSSVYGHNSARALEALYDMQSLERWDAGAQAMLGDELFGAPARFMARHNTRADQPTWTYIFTREAPGKRQSLGAHHAAEIPFVLNTHAANQKRSKSDKHLTDVMGTYWANFAKTGSPNGEELPAWPQYSEAGDVWMELGREIKPAPNFRARKLSVLEDLINRRIDAVIAATPAPLDVPEETASNSQ